MGGVTNFSDRNNSDENDNTKVVITGGDDQYIADVIDENGIKKLFVKASATSAPLGNIFFDRALNADSPNMNVNGSVTNVTFTIDADATKDKVISSMAFQATATFISVDKFLSLNSALTNGVLIEVKSENTVFQFRPITTTQEFDSVFSYGPGRSFEIIFGSGAASMVARFGPTNPFTIKKQGTYGSDDYIKVIIRDNLTSITNLRFLAFGEKV